MPPWRGRWPTSPNKGFLAEPLKQMALIVTHGRMPERWLLRLSWAGHWDMTSKSIYWNVREIAGPLEVERDSGEQTVGHVTQTPGCQNGLKRLIIVIAMNFLGRFFLCVCVLEQLRAAL